MLVPDRVYYLIPQIWLVMGVLFLTLGLVAGRDFQYFYVHLLLGVICLARSLQIYQQRRKISRRNRITVLTETQRIERDTSKNLAQPNN